jgi:hypothetical protein
MKTVIRSSLCAAAFASTLASAQDAQIAIEILVDESGVLQHSEEAANYKMAILAHLKALTRKRRGAKAHIDVIATSYGRTVGTGTPQDLKRNAQQAQELVDKIASDYKRCNNLPGAFDELKSNIAALERQGVREAHALIFSSLIHISLPCDATTHIKLPQRPPAKGDINEALSASEVLRSLTFYWISLHQRRVWEEFLSPALTWAGEKGVRYALFDEVRTHNALRKGIVPLEVRK